VPELIEDGVNGLLFEIGDVDGMAAGAISILSDPALLERFADASRRTAQDHFCASRIIPLYERYYERILSQEPAQDPR
jgi:glycosyltransferase involved in cell wall biosynthesis